MTTNTRALHWSAVIGVACSFWLLFWLLIIVSALYDIRELNWISTDIFNKEAEISGNKNTLIISGIFALWAAYRAKKRLALLKNWVFIRAMFRKDSSESYEIMDGSTSIVTLTNYYFQVKKQKYSNTIWWTFGLKGKNSIEIVYNSQKPSYNKTVRSLRARFNKDANEWRSSMWHVIPRIAIMVFILAGFVALLVR